MALAQDVPTGTRGLSSPDEGNYGACDTNVPSEVQSMSMAEAIGAMAPASHREDTDESFIASTSSHVRLEAQAHDVGRNLSKRNN